MTSADIIKTMRAGGRLFWGVCGPYLIEPKYSVCRNANIRSANSLVRNKLVQRVAGSAEWKLVNNSVCKTRTTQ